MRHKGNSLGNLGIAYLGLEQYENAITYSQQWLDISREIGDRRGEGCSLGNLGLAFDALEEYPKAITFHQQWLDISREIGDKRGEANSWFNLGLTFTKLQNNDDAREAFSNARQLYQDMGINNMVESCDNKINALESDISSP